MENGTLLAMRTNPKPIDIVFENVSYSATRGTFKKGKLSKKIFYFSIILTTIQLNFDKPRIEAFFACLHSRRAVEPNFFF